MKRLRNILIGMAIAGNVLANPRPYTSPNNGFARDKQALRGDSSKVAATFNRQISNQYGKQKYSGQG